MYKLRDADREPFLESLRKLDAVYDENWKAPRGYLEKANYHTNLARQEVHSTRDAFGYAAALLATGEEKDLKRAEEILWHVEALQDKDPSNATYGIWSWYMEEPLEKMSPPDWNWADFCGKEILQVLEFHRDRIGKDLRAALEDALRHACLSIFRRNMNEAYTNISIMGSYVTLHAGQLLDWPWLFLYGKNRFLKFLRYTRGNGGAFAEYNSATYTAVAIEDLSRIASLIRDGEIKRAAEELLDGAWGTVADHFHAPTRQWCGPNARSYTWLTSDATLSFLEQATGHEIPLTDYAGGKENGKRLPHFTYSPGWAYIDLHCPEKYRDAFRKTETKDVNIGFHSDIDLRSPRYSIAVFHKEKEYALGTWATSSAWNQRRSLLGFWGGEKTRFVNLAMLHDLYDFSAGMFTVAQDKGHALVLSSIMSDAGDTHPNLDMIRNEKIRAYDLRVRLEVGGEIGEDWEIRGDEASFESGGRTLRVKLLGASFAGKPCRLEKRRSEDEREILDRKPDLHRRFTGDEKRRYLDVVFYEGEEREIDLASLESAYAAFTVSLDGEEPAFFSLEIAEGKATAFARYPGGTLEAASPAVPVKAALWQGTAKKDGIAFEKLYGRD